MNFKKSHLIFITFLAIVAMVYISCAETNYSKVDCHLIEKMSVQDQLYRNHKKCNPIVHIVDSLSKGDTAFYSEFHEQASNIYLERKDTTFTKGFIDKVTSDSLLKLQLEIDRIQVREVSAWLENIEENRIDTLKCYYDILFILAHTPSEMRDDVKALLKSKSKYIHQINFEYLNRRLGM
jgi:hypothetical protein